jgi:hypothetical protein
MKVQLKHRINQTELNILLRPFEDRDAEEAIACIRDEYGETYFKRDFYNPEFLKKMHREGAITFLVAETDGGELAGILALKSFFPAETMCEIASEIFRKKYRGYGLAKPVLRYGLNMAAEQSYSAACALCVTFHSVTQKILQELGMTATGFIFSIFRVECMESSYPYGRCKKHSQCIQIKPVEKTNAGNIYLPPELIPFADRIYTRLGVNYGLFTSFAAVKEKTRLCFTNNALHRSGSITILRSGTDLKERLDRIIELYRDIPLQTFNVFLNISDPAAVWAYEILKENGFFFTGFKPLCGENEMLVMHNANGVEPYAQDYSLSDELKQLLDDIRPFIKVRG